MDGLEASVGPDRLEGIAIESETDIVKARQRAREVARSIGFSSVETTLIITAVSEVARNIVEFAGRGQVLFGEIHEKGRHGMLIVAEDQGPGIPDVALAMQDGYSSRKSLGMGLPGARRLVDEFRIESSPGRGTRVTLRKWLEG